MNTTDGMRIAKTGTKRVHELIARQKLFTGLKAQLVIYALAQGYELTEAEGSVLPHRDVEVAGKVIVARDRVHRHNSLHYSRLAIDFVLFVNNRHIADGGHPAWKELGEYWESLHPLARWGGYFDDANHFSITFEGVK